MSSPSMAASCSTIVTTFAPRAATSDTLPRVWAATLGLFEISAITGVLSSIKAIVPCLSSPAAKPSHWIYEISLSLRLASIDT